MVEEEEEQTLNLALETAMGMKCQRLHFLKYGMYVLVASLLPRCLSHLPNDTIMVSVTVLVIPGLEGTCDVEIPNQLRFDSCDNNNNLYIK